jgi:parallel beta-helix repeat protein
MLDANEVIAPAAITDGTNPHYDISGNAVYSSPLVEIGSDPTTQDPTIQPVQNITIAGIEFAYSSWVDPSYYGYAGETAGYFSLTSASGTVEDTATMQIPALRIENVEGSLISGNVFQHLGGAGIELYDQSRNNRLVDNTLSDISGDGIIVDGSPVDAQNANGTTIPYRQGLGYNPVHVSESDTIIGNSISTVGAAFPDSCAILASYSDNLTIRYNDIHDLPEMGIQLGAADGAFVKTQGPSGTPIRTSYTNADVEWNNIYQFGQMLEDGGGIYVMGPNWKGPGGLGPSGTVVENNYIHDNPFSQQDGSPTRIVRWNGDVVSLSSHAVYLETHSTGVTAISNDTFDIRSGTGASSDWNNGSHLSSQAGSTGNVLGLPVNSSTIISEAGPAQTFDLNQSLSSGSAPVSYTLSLPYPGTYRVAVRVANVKGPTSALSVKVLGTGFTATDHVAATVNAVSFLLSSPFGNGAGGPTSASFQFGFAGGATSSLILERVWVVPMLVNPYAS